jgi:hypothetical protein
MRMRTPKRMTMRSEHKARRLGDEETGRIAKKSVPRESPPLPVSSSPPLRSDH